MELICIEGYQNTGKTLLTGMLQDALVSDGYTVSKFDQPSTLDLQPLDYWACLPDVFDNEDYAILDTCWITEYFTRSAYQGDNIRYNEILDLYEDLTLIGVTRITYYLLERPWAKQVPDHKDDQVKNRGKGTLVDRYFENLEYSEYLSTDFPKFCFNILPNLTKTYLVYNDTNEESLLECRQKLIF